MEPGKSVVAGCVEASKKDMVSVLPVRLEKSQF